MLYALISDIHANKFALNAVIKDIISYEVDDIICLGDIVGYGPNPKEVLNTVRQHVTNFVIGNHDAVIASKFSQDLFIDEAKFVIKWTAQELGVEGFEFFDNMPFILEGEGFKCAHSELKNPEKFDYITTPERAVVNFRHVDDQVIFVGHTHYPGVYLTGKSGKVYWLPVEDIGDGFNIEPNKRYIVNAGSVGDPRDGDLRASYVLYDTEKQRVFFRRVPFDYEALRKEYQRIGLPEEASYALQAYLKKKTQTRAKYDYLKDLLN